MPLYVIDRFSSRLLFTHIIPNLFIFQIEDINKRSNTISVLVMPSSETHLPPADIAHPEFASNYPDPQSRLLRIQAIENPGQLENALLDTDGQVEKSKRPNGNAWKSTGLWR